MYGELIPAGGGDPIPLLKKSILIGRRESCDIVLRFPNVSAHHCQLTINNGYWFVKDLNSRNGCKVNGMRVTERRLDPGDTLEVAHHKHRIDYSPMDLGAIGPPPDDQVEAIFGKSLLERAGLAKPDGKSKDKEDDPTGRYDPLSDKGGRMKNPFKPI